MLGCFSEGPWSGKTGKLGACDKNKLARSVMDDATTKNMENGQNGPSAWLRLTKVRDDLRACVRIVPIAGCGKK